MSEIPLLMLTREGVGVQADMLCGAALIDRDARQKLSWVFQ